jgi:arginyl-tRNA synthetase
MEGIIRKAIQDVLKRLDIDQVDFAVEHPADLAHGDYATNVAMKARGPIIHGQSKGAFGEINSITVGQSLTDKPITPRELAEKIKSELEGKIPHVAAIEIAGPGFINFRLDREFFSEMLAHIGKAGEEWGRNDSWAGKKVLVEYTDANPFKEFHVGHLFTNAVGESIARIFMMNGADTKRVNYQGDVGLHVAHAIWGMRELGIEAGTDLSAADLGRAYAYGATAYKNEDPRAVLEIREINKKVYDRSDNEVNVLYDKGRTVSLAYFETIYALVGTTFDAYFFESEAAPEGKALVLAHPDIFVESEGAYVFRGEDHGLHTRVFLNKEGLPTYEAKELALAKLKEEHLGVYDLSIVSTSNEINEYFKVLKAAMGFVYPELAPKTEHIGHGTVRLSTGKMSSRTGDVIRALDFISEVADAAAAKMDEGGKTAPSDELANAIALGAIKYATLRGSILQDSIFDKERALSFEGDSGPYLQYTYARIVSVLEKAKEAGVSPNTDHAPDEAYPIEKILYRFEEVIREALLMRSPHLITTYLTELAGAFNTFYAEEKIADASDHYAPYKAALADAVRITLKNGLWTLGIQAPERM